MTTPPGRRDHSSRRPARRRGGADDAPVPAVTAVLAAPAEPVIVRLRPGTAVLLQLVLGVAALITYVALIPVAAALGLPSVAALAAAGLLAVPAVQLGILLAQRRRHHPFETTMALNVRIRLPRLVGWAVLEIVLAGAVFVLTAPLTQLLQARVFGWWPAAWAIQLGTDGRYGDQALLITAALLLLASVLVAPMVEELYFRGFLLPRMPGRLGRWWIRHTSVCSRPTTSGPPGSFRHGRSRSWPWHTSPSEPATYGSASSPTPCSTPPTWLSCLRTSTR